MRRYGFCVAIGLVAACSGRYGADHAGGNTRISVRGSDTLVVLAQGWAEAYMATGRDTTVEVSGGGTGTGIAALLNGTADLATASRAVTLDERARFDAAGEPIVEIPVAIDAVAIYIHTSNSIASISSNELESIFRGRVTRWSDLGGADRPIVLYSRESSSGTYAYFKERVLNHADFAPEVQSLPGTAAIVHAVAQDPNSIGFGGIARAMGVKLVPIRDAAGISTAPTTQNVMSGRYPLTRPLFIVRRVRTSPAAKAFLNWILEPEAQALAEQSGFVAIGEQR